jgi:uncharacterized FlaG/YvyC family protein
MLICARLKLRKGTKMGLDGFSLASIGLPKDVTSAQASASAEQLAQKGLESKVNNINKTGDVTISDEEKEKNKGNKNLKDEFFQDGFEDNEETEENNENKKEEKASKRSKRKPLLKDAENLTVRFNEASETVELYNKVTNRTIETIKAEDLVDLVSKLDYSSGILVNKQI